MGFTTIARRLAAITGGIGLLAAAPLSAATAAAAAPPTYIHVSISDSGFDQASYAVSGGAWPSGLQPTIEFDNVGTQVHTATAPPGVTGAALTVIKVDAGGGTVQCFQNGPANKCDHFGPLDTGGIEPGGHAVVALAGGNSPSRLGPPGGVYTFTSATDCLNGNSNPNFDCTPSTAKVSATPPPPNWTGSVFDAAGSADCAVGSVMEPPNGTPVCRTALRHWQTGQGSLSHPLDNVAISIDDVRGFQPTLAWVKMGGTVTWTNNGRNVHTLNGMAPFNMYDGPLMGDGFTLYPGQSYSWTTPGSHPCTVHTGEPLCASAFQWFQSRAPMDIIPPSSSGFPGILGGFCVGHSAANCGQSGMTGSLTLVDTSQS